METAIAIAIALTFVWLGMVLAISFLETPLKFQAPQVTLPIGLGIGRIVFRALNVCEFVLAVAIVICLVIEKFGTTANIGLSIAVLALVIQIVLVRPALTRRSNEVMAGRGGPRSNTHLIYVALEIVKVIALITGGVAALTAS